MSKADRGELRFTNIPLAEEDTRPRRYKLGGQKARSEETEQPKRGMAMEAKGGEAILSQSFQRGAPLAKVWSKNVSNI